MDDAYSAAGEPDWQKTRADCTTRSPTEDGRHGAGANRGIYPMAHSERYADDHILDTPEWL